MKKFQVKPANYHSAEDSKALVFLLNAYALDPMGGGQALSLEASSHLCADLAQISGAVSFIAWQLPASAAEPASGAAAQTSTSLALEPIGLINCFEGYSTFKAKPLLNVHDIAVLPAFRGQGVGQALLQAAQDHAHARGCCKLSLEVLSGNHPALQSYRRFGFAQYELDPNAGQAQFMQKWL